MNKAARTEETFITGKRGQKIAIKTYFPPEADSRYPVVIFSHGFGGNYRNIERHGSTMAARGIACVFLDFCGGGMESRSDGTMREMTVMTEVSDLEDVYTYVLSLGGTDPDSVFLMGESQGGFVSAYAASVLKEKIRGLILWYPAFVIPDDSVRRLAEGITDFGGVQLSPDYDRVAAQIDTRAVMKAYDGPVLIIHGDRDGVVPVRYAEEADEVYADSTLYIINGAGHGFGAHDDVFAIDTSVDFVIEHLPLRRKLFTLHINCYDSHEVTDGDVTFRQILFDGYAEGELFNGRIMPGGVDTQTVHAAGAGELSARYILEGEDAAGAPCKMYIDNRGNTTDPVTYPVIKTDSELIRRLGSAPVVGRKVDDEEGFKIEIYRCDVQ